MADILDFRPVEGRSARRSGARTASCEIVIFPGVRYEHWERKASIPAQEKQKAARRRVKRDRLEIAD